MKQLSRVIALLWTISVVSSILQSQDDTPKTELKLVQIVKLIIFIISPKIKSWFISN